MLYLVILILLVFLILIIFIVQKGYIFVEYTRDGWEDELTVTFSTLGGLLVLEYELPFTKLNLNGLKFIRRKKKKGKKETEKDKKAIPANVSLRLMELFERFQYFREREKNAMDENISKYLSDKVRLEVIRLEVEAGTGDAFYTGTLNGIIWSAAGVFTAYLTNKFNPAIQQINVKPNYMAKSFKIDFHCIFSIKNVHIIVVGIRYLLKARKRYYNEQDKFSR